LKDAAEKLFAPADTDEQKARNIYAAVQKLENTNFSRKKSEAEEKREKIKEIRNADDVWKQQSGSANDIALLYIALARAAGLKVFPAQVVDRNRAIFDTRYLSTKQLDDYLAILVLDGKEVYLDPGQKMCPSPACTGSTLSHRAFEPRTKTRLPSRHPPPHTRPPRLSA